MCLYLCKIQPSSYDSSCRGATERVIVTSITLVLTKRSHEAGYVKSRVSTLEFRLVLRVAMIWCEVERMGGTGYVQCHDPFQFFLTNVPLVAEPERLAWHTSEIGLTLFTLFTISSISTRYTKLTHNVRT